MFHVKHLMIIVSLMVTTTVWANKAEPMVNGDLSAQSPVSAPITVCMDFGCKNPHSVQISKADWQTVAGWFSPVAETPEAEREQIKSAIGWMEEVIGRYTPTHNDIGGNLNEEGETIFPGQLDCIDESLNTTTYLRLFELHGLLKHHKVLDRAYRQSLFDQHWAGQVQTPNGERWVVDSWFQHNGYLPYVQLAEKWEKIPLITSYLDSSQPRPDGEKRSWIERLLLPE